MMSCARNYNVVAVSAFCSAGISPSKKDMPAAARMMTPRRTAGVAAAAAVPSPAVTTASLTNANGSATVLEKSSSDSPADAGRSPAQTALPAPRLRRRRRPSAPPTPATASPAAAFFSALESVINNFIDPPALRPSVDPRNVLSDNFAPVTELPPTPCAVVRGTIPRSLAGGVYIRNGPNPQHLPRGPHHLFDGDGMLHSLLIPSSASPVLCSRFVRTYRYEVERAAGAPVFPSVFSAFHGAAGMARGAVAAARVLAGQMNPVEGVGLANTSLVFFNDQLYALGESDLPYAVRVDPHTGEVTTAGRCDFDGKLFMGMTAHPKLDAATGELFAFRYGPLPPFLTYFRFDRAGNKLPDVPIFSLRQPTFLHDFAITSNYAVFADIQIVMQPTEMMFNNGAPVGSDKAKISRIGVLPRYAGDESAIRWFDVPGFNPVHMVNAWEENGGDMLVVIGPNVLSVEHTLDKMELIHSSVEMARIDLRRGVVSRTPLSVENADFGVIHPAYVGRRSRYAYFGVGDPMPKIAGIVKLDFNKAGKGDCTVARRDFGPGCFAGEPIFVPEEDGEEEDDGYLVCYVHNEASEESTFVVMDARSETLDIVAEVALPERVPYGFHGIFVTEAQLRAQRSPAVAGRRR